MAPLQSYKPRAMKSGSPLDFADPVLTVENLRVGFATEFGEVPALDGIDFTVPRGSCVALVGESGSGKSVTANAILRLIQSPGKIHSGRITLYTKDSAPLSVESLQESDPQLYRLRGGLVSMVFQEPMTALSPVHTIGNQIMEAILLHCAVGKARAWELAAEMLERVGIPEPERRLRQYPHEFSGGMRQRVVIAMALVSNPQLLIADEPTTALDVTIQAQILQLIRAEQDRIGSSVLFITHDMGVVAQIADYVCVMYHGKILEKGPVRSILRDARHPYTRGLLAALPGSVPAGERLPTIQSVVGDATFPLGKRFESVGEEHLVACE
jgi:ABC-type dipeptide/oligopeptide/nickel transport system ATPase component